MADSRREYLICYNCSKELLDYHVLKYSHCTVVTYCSKQCEIEHWHLHKYSCCELQQVGLHYEKSYAPKTMQVSHSTRESCNKVTNVVDEKCLVSYVLDRRFQKTLRDAGAKDSMVSTEWLKEHLPSIMKVRSPCIFEMKLKVILKCTVAFVKQTKRVQ